MSATVIQLHKPTKTNKERTLELIDQVRQLVLKGDAVELICVFTTSEGGFGSAHCRGPITSNFIGAMELAKLSLMDEYAAQAAGEDHESDPD